MQQLIIGTVFTRKDIAALFGGNARAFLPRPRGGAVVAGCFDPAMNPRAPFEALVHGAPNALLAAQQLIEQSRSLNGAIPVFVRLAANVWEYRGRYRAVRYGCEENEVAARIYEIRPRVYEKHVREYGEIRGVLYLEEESEGLGFSGLRLRK